MPRIIIGVMGPGEMATREECADAYNVGRAIAEAGWVVLTGGRNAGVMQAACQGAKAAGGLTVGILPGSSPKDTAAEVDIPIYTGLGHARNAVNVLSSQVVVACGMGSGTASEVALAIKSGKPVVLLKPNEASLKFFCEVSMESVQVIESVEELVACVRPLLTM